MKSSGTLLIGALCLFAAPAGNASAQALAEYSRVLGPAQAGRGAVQSMGDAIRRQSGRASLAGSAEGDAAPKAAASAVSVSGNVEGGSVLIGGIDRGALPVRDLALEPGSYSVRVMKYGYREYRGELEVKEGAPATLDVRLEKIQF